MSFSFEPPELLCDDSGRILREAVEYSVVDHCNLRCAGCDHASPQLPKKFADPEAFAADMAVLSHHLHVRVLRLVGGEPLLHPALDAFVRAAREVRIADRIMLWTNGLLLHKVPREFLEAFDVVRVSVYPGINIQADLAELSRELKGKGHTRLEVARVTRFQHQLLNEPIEDPRLVRRTYLRCKEAHLWSCHSVVDGRYYKCAKPAALEPRLSLYGIDVSNRVRDGVALHGNPKLGEELRRYLLSSEPLIACSWCLGTDGKSFSHHQISQSTRRTAPPANDPRALIASPLRRLARDARQRLGSLIK